MLDVAGTELNPLGYNHALFRDLISGQAADHSIINGAAGDQVASANFAALTRSTLGPLAPSGLNGIFLSNAQNASSEAVRHAMIERDGENFNTLSFSGSQGVQYPTSQADESKVLESVRSTMQSSGPFAAIVIEPTQQSSGLSVSDSFIDKLAGIAEDFEAALVVDETGTGCGASG